MGAGYAPLSERSLRAAESRNRIRRTCTGSSRRSRRYRWFSMTDALARTVAVPSPGLAARHCSMSGLRDMSMKRIKPSGGYVATASECTQIRRARARRRGVGPGGPSRGRGCDGIAKRSPERPVSCNAQPPPAACGGGTFKHRFERRCPPLLAEILDGFEHASRGIGAPAVLQLKRINRRSINLG